MSEHIRQTLADAQQEVRQVESLLREKKRLVNGLCDMLKEQPMYPDAERESAPTAGIRSDEFFGQPLSAVARMILEKRKTANQGAATVVELYDAMRAGGYDFDTTDEANEKRKLRISLTKNSSIFHKVPPNRYGLLDWYPTAKKDKGNGGGSSKTVHEVTDDVTAEDEAEALAAMDQEFFGEAQETKEASDRAKVGAK